MHIPDGYLGPTTCGFFYVVMLPIWAMASRIVKKTLKAKQVPMLAIGAAFSFVIMMFNVPIPCGSTGHAAGGVLAAILLGPWAACIAITVALVVQALLFGDGGITAIGANCFNIAFVLPFTGYYLYKWISGNCPVNSPPEFPPKCLADSPFFVANIADPPRFVAGKRRIIAAGVAGYAALNLAALFTGIEFGLQPLLHHSANGQALYCPYGLNVAVPIMAGEHLLFFGWVEAIVTALVVKYLQKHSPEIF